MSDNSAPAGQWPEVVPLDEALEVPAFPTDSMPWWVADFVRAQSVASQVPEDMTGMLALSALSAALQGRVSAVAGSWVEPITFYTAVAMSPGERKSSVFEHVTKPLVDWELDVQALQIREVAASQQRQSELEGVVDATAAQVKKLGSTLRALRANELAAPDTVRAAMADLEVARADEENARVALAEHKAVHKMRLVYNDLTPEAASKALSQQKHESMAIMSDEGGVFEVLTGGRYSDKLNLDVFLKSHSGNRIQVDRVGRESETIMRPMMTLGLAVQPSVLRDIGKSKQMQGRGLLARFAYSMPQTLLGRRLSRPDPVANTIRDEYNSGTRAIAQAAYELDAVRLVYLEDDALEKLIEFQDSLEVRLEPDVGDLDPVVEWASKEVGLVLRISVLLAAARVRGVPNEIRLEDIEAGVAFAPYLEAHAWLVFSLMGLVASDDLKHKIMKRLVRERITEFKTRDLIHKLRAARAYSTEELDEVLDELQKMGYIKRVVTSLKPQRVHWIVNPAVYEE